MQSLSTSLGRATYSAWKPNPRLTALAASSECRRRERASDAVLRMISLFYGDEAPAAEGADIPSKEKRKNVFIQFLPLRSLSVCHLRVTTDETDSTSVHLCVNLSHALPLPGEKGALMIVKAIKDILKAGNFLSAENIAKIVEGTGFRIQDYRFDCRQIDVSFSVGSRTTPVWNRDT